MSSFKKKNISLSLAALFAAPVLAATESYPLSQLVQIDSGSSVEVSITGPISRTHPLSVSTRSASSPQLNPLKTAITIEFQSQAVTVGAAAEAIAVSLGYQLLASGQNVSAQTRELLISNLPLVHSKFINLPADEILRSLSGPGFIPVVDHVSRLITFDPIPIFSKTGHYAIQTREISSILNETRWQTVPSEAEKNEFVPAPVLEEQAQNTLASNDVKPIPVRPTVKERLMLDQAPSEARIASIPKPLVKVPIANESEVKSIATTQTLSDSLSATAHVSSTDAELLGFKAVSGSVLMFNRNTATLKSNYRSTIEELQRNLVPETDKIRLIGCAMPSKTKMILAKQRAAAVSKALVQAGIPSVLIQNTTCFHDDSVIVAEPESVFVDLMRL